jgi:hypothetical protein
MKPQVLHAAVLVVTRGKDTIVYGGDIRMESLVLPPNRNIHDPDKVHQI